MIKKLEEGDIILCTVDRIVGTNVFVKIPKGEKEIEGYIVFSEISPGRIRNIRNYVVPKKKIVCKVLRISKDRIELSLRRVTKKEKEEEIEKNKQEKSYKNIIKSVLKEKAENIIKEISKEESIYSFLQEAIKNPEKIEKIIGKSNSKKILDILKKQRVKKAIIKKEFFLTTKEPEGINIIKNILKKIKKVDIRYISAGRYSLKKESDNIKKADNELKTILKDIEKKAKSNNTEFSIIKK